MFQAVMFDMDGLMIDSEPLAKAAWQQTVARFGHTLDDSQFSQMLGCRQSECARKICAWFSLPEDPDQLARTRNQEFMQLLPGKVHPMPGLFELLQWLASHDIPRALVTSGLPDYVKAVARELKLEDSFSVTVTAADVQNGKPAPDCYQLAARRLNRAPSACLALEDAPNGVTAAKSAGLTCWAIPNNETRGLDLSHADRILRSLLTVRDTLTNSL
jgi:HAD superfamily hydrolase (TIGR01509 family)